MHNVDNLASAFAAGVLLGVMFYGGLWWTVKRALMSKREALWFSGSGLLRTVVVMAGFYFVARNDWKRLVVCLLGFIVSRLMITRLTRFAEMPNRRRPEDAHAS